MSEVKKDTRLGILMGSIFFATLLTWIVVSINTISEQGKAIYIHNPHVSEMKIEIGEDHYSLRSNESRQIDVSQGKYHVKSFLEGDVFALTV